MSGENELVNRLLKIEVATEKDGRFVGIRISARGTDCFGLIWSDQSFPGIRHGDHFPPKILSTIDYKEVFIRCEDIPDISNDDELLDELTNEFRAGFAEDYRKKTVPVKPEPEWQPMETAPRDGTVIEILFQIKPFNDAIYRCKNSKAGAAGCYWYGWHSVEDRVCMREDHAKGWRPIDEQ